MTFTDRMKAELDEVAGGEFERLAGSHARERWPIDRHPYKLGEKWRLGFMGGAVWARGMFRRDAEKAERERDAYQHDARAAESALSRVRAALGLPDDATTDDMEEAAESRHLTPEAITDEMVERYLNHRDPDEVRDWRLAGYRDDLVEKARAHLVAALTKPTRPEEKVERVLRRYWSGDINGDDLAARIVEEMNR